MQSCLGRSPDAMKWRAGTASSAPFSQLRAVFLLRSDHLDIVSEPLYFAGVPVAGRQNTERNSNCELANDGRSRSDRHGEACWTRRNTAMDGWRTSRRVYYFFSKLNNIRGPCLKYFA